MKKIGLVSCILSLVSSAAHAVCPLCTLAVAGGLEVARRSGVDETILGVWAGAFALAILFLLARQMGKRNVQHPLWYVGLIIFVYGFFYFLYSVSALTFGENLLFGIDKFVLGVIAGTIVFRAASKWNVKLLAQNGGKSYFKFQKVAIPFGSLLLTSGVFALIVYML